MKANTCKRMNQRRYGVRSLVTLAALAALAVAAPGPRAAAHQLVHPAAADPAAPVLAAVAVSAWALAAWLLLVAVLTTAGRVPGTLGQVASALSRRVAPAAVRRALEALLGLTVAASALGAPPASAADPTPPAPRPAAELTLDWPGTASPPALDWAPPPPTEPVPTSSPARPAPAHPREALPAVAVRPGDTLWDIAAEHLSAPTPAAVARSWPRWWAANRAVIGSDPDLILPGTRLVPPSDPSAR
jgi:resuscitation-promoting factor RpfA